MVAAKFSIPWKFIRWFVLGLLAVFVILPLLTPGFIPTHDGEYHLIRIWQFDKMLGNGYLIPRWAPDLNSGYGLPLFNFQYPFPNYVGAFWHRLGWSLVDSVKLTLATGYVGAIIFCYLWLGTQFPVVAAWAGTIFFMFVPYWFINIYVRGSMGEVLAMSWVMMALWATEQKSRILLAISIGLLIVTHNISAMLFVPVISAYLFFRQRKLWPALILGMGLATYFWIPALWEKHYMTGLNTSNYLDYFPRLDQLLIPSWGTGFSGGMMTANDMSPQIGLLPMFLFAASALLMVVDAFRRKLKVINIFWGILLISAIIMMLTISHPIWALLPFFALIQYPWRFLSFVIITSAFFGAYVSSKIPKIITVLLLVAAVGLTASYIRPVIYRPRSDAYYLSRSNFTDGTSSLGNALSTIWTGWKQQRPASNIEIVSDTTIQINTLYYPGWRVFVDNKSVPIKNVSGVIQVDVPKRTHSIKAVFGETPLRHFADFISLVSLAYLGYTTFQVYAHRHKHASAYHRTQRPRHRDIYT